MRSILTNIILSGTGASFVLLVLTRLLPNTIVHAVSLRLGRAMTGFGRMNFGKSFWEKLEDFIENSVGVFWEGLREGFNSDDGEDRD